MCLGGGLASNSANPAQKEATSHVDQFKGMGASRVRIRVIKFNRHHALRSAREYARQRFSHSALSGSRTAAKIEFAQPHQEECHHIGKCLKRVDDPDICVRYLV